MEEPGGGAVRRGLPLVPFYPSSAAATPSPRSAQRAPGPSTHLPAGPGRAEGGARALEAPRRHCACPGEGRGGTGSGGRARPHHPPGSVRLASGQWPRRARARVWEPAGSQFARQACAEPRGGGGQSILEVTGGGAGQARPCRRRLLVWASPPPSGPLGGKSAIQGDRKCWASARARVAVWAGVSFVSRAFPRRWAARAQQSLYRGAQDLELCFPCPSVGPPSCTDSIPST